MGIANTLRDISEEASLNKAEKVSLQEIAKEYEQLEADNKRPKEDYDFLLNRAAKAGSCSFRGDRDTGVSSNSIVAIAYGQIEIKEQELPSDSSDLMACKKMWEKLPKHRKTADAIKAMNQAEQALIQRS